MGTTRRVQVGNDKTSHGPENAEYLFFNHALAKESILPSRIIDSVYDGENDLRGVERYLYRLMFSFRLCKVARCGVLNFPSDRNCHGYKCSMSLCVR